MYRSKEEEEVEETATTIDRTIDQTNAEVEESKKSLESCDSLSTITSIGMLRLFVVVIAAFLGML